MVTKPQPTEFLNTVQEKTLIILSETIGGEVVILSKGHLMLIGDEKAKRGFDEIFGDIKKKRDFAILN